MRRSWDPLPTDARRLLAALSVFRGPASLDALIAVFGDRDILPPPPTVRRLARRGPPGRPLRGSVRSARSSLPPSRPTSRRPSNDGTPTTSSTRPKRRSVDAAIPTASTSSPSSPASSTTCGPSPPVRTGPRNPRPRCVDPGGAGGRSARTPGRGPRPPGHLGLAPGLRAAAHLSACRGHRRLGDLGPGPDPPPSRRRRGPRRRPRDPGADNTNVAMVLISEGQLGAARTLLERTLDAPGVDRPLCALRLGIALRELGDPVAAQTRCSRPSPGSGRTARRTSSSSRSPSSPTASSTSTIPERARGSTRPTGVGAPRPGAGQP